MRARNEGPQAPTIRSLDLVLYYNVLVGCNDKPMILDRELKLTQNNNYIHSDFSAFSEL